MVDFSIIIPTFNRSGFLKLAILSVLRQKKVTFEIIICDDASTDDTERMVKSFEDKRIKYYKNRSRLGTSMNFMKCFEYSSGDYIFTLGDDDFILDENTLSIVLAQMKKNKVGMGKIGTITYEQSYVSPYQISILCKTNLILKPDSTENILVDAINFGLGFYSGLIFNNKLLNKKYLKMDHICYPDHMCHSYHEVAYDLILHKGIEYISDVFIVSRLSLNLIPRYFNLTKHKRIYWEDPINQAKTLLRESDFKAYQYAYIRSQLVMLPNIKFFTDYSNYIRVLRKIVKLDSAILRDKYFIFWSITGFTPNWIIGVIRRVKIYLTQKKTQRILDGYNYKEKIMTISAYFKNFSKI